MDRHGGPGLEDEPDHGDVPEPLRVGAAVAVRVQRTGEAAEHDRDNGTPHCAVGSTQEPRPGGRRGYPPNQLACGDACDESHLQRLALALATARAQGLDSLCHPPRGPSRAERSRSRRRAASDTRRHRHDSRSGPSAPRAAPKGAPDVPVRQVGGARLGRQALRRPSSCCCGAPSTWPTCTT